jgi:CRISPR-associated protein Cmr1
MSRTILDCPDVPDLKADERHPYSITKTYAITVITPIFGGGAEAGRNDPATFIRPSSVRGHLRFWWRATRGARFHTVAELHQREGEIWGTTDNPSPVTIQVDPPQWSLKREPNDDYGFPRYGAEAYALFSAKQNGNELCKEGLSFSLSLCWLTPTKLQALRDQENKQRREANKPLLPEKIQDISLDIEAAVWAWLNFGGIGARTRRGCGALFCPKIQPQIPSFHPPSIDGFTRWCKEKAEQYEFPLLTSPVHRAWPTFPSTICLKKGVTDALASWSDAIGVLRQFRQGRNDGRDPGGKTPSRSRWPEAEAVRTLVISHQGLGTRPGSWHGVDTRMIPALSFPRAEFGMPIIFELRDERVPYTTPTRNPPPNLKPSLQPSEDTDRMASPVILRPICFSDKQVASMIAVLNTAPLASAYLKPGERDLASGVALSPSQIRAPSLASYFTSAFV